MDEIDVAMVNLLRICNENITLGDPRSFEVTAPSGKAEAVVHWVAHGFRQVDVAALRKDCLHAGTYPFYHGSSLTSATLIFADTFLKKGGGHSQGKSDAVLGRRTLEEAWFSNKNRGIVWEGTMHGSLRNYKKVRAQVGCDDKDWRVQHCSRLGGHMHHRHTGESELYMNQESIELTGFYVRKTNATSIELKRVFQNKQTPVRRRR